VRSAVGHRCDGKSLCHGDISLAHKGSRRSFHTLSTASSPQPSPFSVWSDLRLPRAQSDKLRLAL
jgi:hypothetical protein